MRARRIAAAAGTAAALLAGCGGVKIAPTPILPKPLVAKNPATIGVLLAPDMRSFVHAENRGGVPWSIDLAEGHRRLATEVMGAAFAEAREFDSLDAAKGAAGLAAIFEPRIEQYSFATARETGGDYVAVTIRYRINLLTPAGDAYDSFTLTGYGNSLAGGMSSSAPLEEATRGAMRDAAAKFLTQFPLQDVAKRLQKGETLVVDATQSSGAGALSALQAIQAVPVRDPRRRQLNLPTAPP